MTAGLSFNVIGSAFLSENGKDDFVPETVYVGPDQILALDIFGNGGNLDTGQINWGFFGWTVPAPRTEDGGLALAPFKAIVVP